MYAIIRQARHVDFQLPQTRKGSKGPSAPITNTAASLQPNILKRQLCQFREIALHVGVGKIQVAKIMKRPDMLEDAIIDGHLAQYQTL